MGEHENIIKLLDILSICFSFPEKNIWTDELLNIIDIISKDLNIKCSSKEYRLPHLNDLQAEYTRLFINTGVDKIVAPYASVYLDDAGLLCQEGLEEALNFYKRAGFSPLPSSEPQDHIMHELSFLARLIEKDNWELFCEFLNNHLIKWFPAFYTRLLKAKPICFYEQVAKITNFVLSQAREEVCQ